MIVNDVVEPSVGYNDISANRCDTSLIGLSASSNSPNVESFAWENEFSSFVQTTNAVNYSGVLPTTYTITPVGGKLFPLGKSNNSSGTLAQLNDNTKIEFKQRSKLLSAGVTVSTLFGSCTNESFVYEIRKDSLTGELILKDSVTVTNCDSITVLPINLKFEKGVYFCVFKGISGSLRVYKDYDFDGQSFEENEVLKVETTPSSGIHRAVFTDFIVESVIPCAQSIDFTITGKCNVLSAFDNSTTNNLAIYPNPSNSSFTIDNSDYTISSLKV